MFIEVFLLCHFVNQNFPTYNATKDANWLVLGNQVDDIWVN